MGEFISLKRSPICKLEFNWPWLAAESSYLPGRGDTVIIKAVPLGWGPPIALRLGWPLGLPQMRVTPRRNFCVWGLAFALAPAKNDKTFLEYDIVTIMLKTIILSPDRFSCWPIFVEGKKMWNASRFCVSSLRRGHANLLCIVPILVDAAPKGERRLIILHLSLTQKCTN